MNPSKKLASLETLKVCDLLMVVSPVSAHEPSEAVDQCLPTLKALGIPQTLLALRGLDDVKQSKRQEVKKAMHNIIVNALQVPTERVKALPATSRAEFAEVVRQTVEMRGETPRWRHQRPYILAQRRDVIPNPSDERFATVVVEGYVRAVPANASQLWHLPGVGDFPVTKIESIQEPLEARLNAGRRNLDHTMDGDEVLMTCTRDPEIAQDVMRENEPDDTAGEQTWPTATELEAAELEAAPVMPGCRSAPTTMSSTPSPYTFLAVFGASSPPRFSVRRSSSSTFTAILTRVAGCCTDARTAAPSSAPRSSSPSPRSPRYPSRPPTPSSAT